jgi:hypothetical protein
MKNRREIGTASSRVQASCGSGCGVECTPPADLRGARAQSDFDRLGCVHCSVEVFAFLAFA